MRKSLVLLISLVLVWTAAVAATGQGQPRAAKKPAKNACGTVIYKSPGVPWTCTFHDDFNGTKLDRKKWMPQTYFVTGTKRAHACYRSDNIAVANGQLNLTVRRERRSFTCENPLMGRTTRYSAGSVMTYHLFSQEYGRFEARIKVSKTAQPGLQEAFWLWPDDRTNGTAKWPAAGEIDVAEMYSGKDDRAVPYLHYTSNDNGAAIQGVNTSKDCVAMRGVYNRYTLVWSVKQLQIYVNGKHCLTNTSGDPAFRKKYIIALTSMLGATNNALTARTLLPSTMSVDYVRVWL